MLATVRSGDLPRRPRSPGDLIGYAASTDFISSGFLRRNWTSWSATSPVTQRPLSWWLRWRRRSEGNTFYAEELTEHLLHLTGEGRRSA